MIKNYFDLVDPKPDFPKMEKDLLDKWYKEGIVKKYLTKNNSSKKNFSFLDGPITANNPMGVHHAWGRTYKDLWQRYKNMQGFKERFQNGFDCQGLWVEVEVEKELGFKSKKDIEKFGVAEFVQKCRDRVNKYSTIQTEQSKRLGYFMDWDNSYYTMSDENNYAIWNFLKRCNDMGLIYKGHDVVAWCPRCETAISQHEMLTEDYKEIIHDSIFIEYPLTGRINTYLLVWTTTPWTLPGNVAVAVDPNKEYVETDGGYVLIKEAAERLKLKVKKTFKGKELVGLNYSSPFDNLPRVKKTLGDYKHRIIATDSLILPVSSNEGTGLIHVACGQGSEDYQLGKKENLPVIELINDEAYYLKGMDEFSCQSAKKHPEIIIDYLKAKDSLFDTQKYTHRYPACWRCKTELVWKVTDEWYIAMDEGTPSLREKMVEVTKKIKWLPEFGLERELDWLKNMHDWMISKKNRYWGLALPIWECLKCHNFEIIGSFDELKEEAKEGWDKFEGHTPHKPWIDEVKIKCSKCGEVVSRIDDVGNPWLDAGIIPYSTIGENEWKNWLPADFITESFPGQFKNWFYSLIAMSSVLENMEPFKTVLGFGTLFGEDGRAMHKSWGNSIEFNEGADKIGVDVMRWMYARANPADNMIFGYKIADEVRRRFHLKLWNIYNFFVTYANLDGWSPSAKAMGDKKPKLSVLDEWILVRLNQTTILATEGLDKFDAFTASDQIDKFVDDLSLWYIRRSRSRVGPAAESKEDKNAFYHTTHYILHTTALLLAPFTPFLSDVIYKNLTKEESIHLSAWPQGEILSNKDIKILSEMQRVREIVEKAHAIRKEKAISVKQALLSFSTTEKPVSGNLEYLLKEEINVKKIVWNSKTDEFDTKITPELEEEAKARDLMRKIQGERKNMGLNLTQKINVSNVWVPTDAKLKNWLMRKAQVKSISEGEFNVKKIQI
ncbi:MAG: isoleucine--tRNA ligase [Patescibacteria group bacterium]